MKRVCAWCRVELDSSAILSLTDDPITHGVCRPCADNAVFQMGIGVRDYLDSLPAPILVVDREGIVKTANNKACDMLGKDLSAIEGYRGGVVFECRYAKLPDGCGRTIHCSGCTIRRAVMDTMSTGKALWGVPAYLHRAAGEGPAEVAFRVSTEKVGNVVLLRIDEVKESTSPRAGATDAR